MASDDSDTDEECVLGASSSAKDVGCVVNGSIDIYDIC